MVIMMKRVHAPEKSSCSTCKSQQPKTSRFAARSFGSRAEDSDLTEDEMPRSLPDFNLMSLPLHAPVQPKPKPNRTGMPDGLKAGIESLSGIDMSDVRVHHNSDKPTHLNALAYAQGNQIHLGPGQERHLPHEAWHVVQQKQGKVRATMQLKGVAVNDDEGLEHEADVMGGNAAVGKPISRKFVNQVHPNVTLQKLCIPFMGAFGDIMQRIPKVRGEFLPPTPREGASLIAKGNPLSATFDVKARFDLEGDNEDYGFGQYRQYVKGVFLSEAAPQEHFLMDGKLSPFKWIEDKQSSVKYGYRFRSQCRYTDESDELDMRHGRFYESTDSPGAGSVDDVMDLHFKGTLIDTGNGNQVVAERHWSIYGNKTHQR